MAEKNLATKDKEVETGEVIKAEKGKKYLANAFSLGMLDLQKEEHHLKIKELSKEDFCKEIRENSIINAIGHESTVMLINEMCGTNFTVNRINIKLENGDELLIIQILERLPEGKILNREEIEGLLKAGKIKFLKIEYFN